MRFLYVAHGDCWLAIENEPAVALSSGMLAVLPHGHRFVVRDQSRRTPIRFEELVRSTHHIKCGGGREAEANVIDGAFTIEDPFETPLLVGEPPLAYLTRSRMQRASQHRRAGATLAKASVLAGYASESSFSYAFRQWAARKFKRGFGRRWFPAVVPGEGLRRGVGRALGSMTRA